MGRYIIANLDKLRSDIHTYERKLRLTNGDFANRANMSAGTISRFKGIGNIQGSTLRKICDVIKKDPNSYIVSGNNKTAKSAGNKNRRVPYDVESIRTDIRDMVNEEGLTNKGFAVKYGVPVRTLADFLEGKYETTCVGTLRNLCSGTGLNLEDYRIVADDLSDKIERILERVAEEVLEKAFERFLENHLEDFAVKKKKRWF